MKFKILSLALALCACLVFISTGNAQNISKNISSFRLPTHLTKSDYLPNTIIFKMKAEFRSNCRSASIENDKLNAVFISINGSAVKLFPDKAAPVAQRNAAGQKLTDISLIYKLNFKADANLEKVVNKIIATGMVEYAEPFYVSRVSYSPNDPGTGTQYFLSKINAYSAWNINKGDTNVVIGIVDTGTDWDHPDLIGNIKYNYNDTINGIDDDGDGYIDNYRGWDIADQDNNPMVDGGGAQEHGSHVSGCAAASTDNAIGVASPGFYCKFLPVKASRASDPNAFLTGGYEGIIYAADHGCSIINCSWGSNGGGQYGQDAITYATVNKGALVVCAAGNDNNQLLHYPSAFQYAFAIASTTSNDTKSTFSNYGNYVDLCAPGTNIYSTLWNNTYGNLSGTSMASPIAAGCAAIVKSYFPNYNGIQVGEQLRVTSDNIYSIGSNYFYQDKLGRGRVNLYNALTVTSPSVRFENKLTTDNADNAFVIGDTLAISGDFINYLAATGNLDVTLTTSSSYVTIIRGTYNIGALPTLATDNNVAQPFLAVINPGAPQNTVVTFKLTFSDGAYQDFQLFEEIVNVDYINITINDVATTVTSKGRLCWNATAKMEGLGFNYLGNQLNYEAGLMVGSNSEVSDNVRAGSALFDDDFLPVLTIQKLIPSVKSEFDLFGTFSDNRAAAPLNIEVKHKAFAWSTPGNRKYIIVEYNIKNKGSASIDSLYAGIFADWDIMLYDSNRIAEDPATKMGYAFSTEANGLYAGIKLLTAGPFIHYAIDNIQGGAGGADLYGDFTSAEKYITLSTSRAEAGLAGRGNDVIDVVSTGPFLVNAGDSVKVAFALIAGDSVPDLIEHARNAQIKYDEATAIQKNNGNEFMAPVAYPNPAQNELNIKILILKPETVSFTIYNSLGQVMQKFSAKNLLPGYQSINVNTANFDTGIYFYDMEFSNRSYRNKFTVIK